MGTLALKPWPLKYRPLRWLLQNIHMSFTLVLALRIQALRLLKDILYTLWSFVVVYSKNCTHVLVLKGRPNVLGCHLVVQGNVVFLYSCFYLSKNVVFVPFNELLADLLPVSQMPIFL